MSGLSTIVAVFAHPDDESFICGGTLAKYAEEGHRVVLVCATLGEAGRRMGVPPIASRESIARLREAELQAACEALSIERLVLLGLRDKTLEIQDEVALASRVEEILQEETPDAIITFHDPLGGHPDHCAIGRVATRAYQTYTAKLERALVPRLFYLAWTGDSSVYTVHPQPVQQVVEISIRDHKKAKLASFRAHKTQSGMNKEIWKSEKQSLSRLSDTEFFVHSLGPALTEKGTLI